jgi:hypothetical protein
MPPKSCRAFLTSFLSATTAQNFPPLRKSSRMFPTKSLRLSALASNLLRSRSLGRIVAEVHFPKLQSEGSVKDFGAEHVGRLVYVHRPDDVKVGWQR